MTLSESKGIGWMSAIRFFGLALLSALVVGCGGSLHLYNLRTGNMGNLRYSHGVDGSRGTISGSLSGEAFSGEYSVVTNAAIGWGSIYGTAGNATATSIAIGRRFGSAVLTGDKQTVLDCEFVLNGLSAHGAGACKDNHGDSYRMLF